MRIAKRSRPTLVRLAVAASVWVAMAMPVQAGDKKDAAQEFQTAAEMTDIRAPGSPPFELDAKVDIWGNDSKPIPGSYRLVWVSPSEWREELSFSGYSRVRVGGKDKFWQQRSLDYEPLQISELSNALGFAASLRAEKSPGKLKTRKDSGMVLDCAQSGSGFGNREYCFDRPQRVLVLEEDPNGPTGKPYSFRYSDFQEFGQRRFPDKIEVLIGRIPLADFSVERLASIEKADPAGFVPPQGASLWLTCSNPQKPRLVSEVNPVYPMPEKRAHRSGTVLIYALIAADGSVQNATVLASPSGAFSDAALAAVRQWRYEPKRCGDTPTPVETFIHVVFALGQG
jgi:TonB family protein